MTIWLTSSVFCLDSAEQQFYLFGQTSNSQAWGQPNGDTSPLWWMFSGTRVGLLLETIRAKNYQVCIYLIRALDALRTVWPDKNRQISLKVAQKWFHHKIIDFDNFTKITCGRFGQINCCQRLWTVAQSPIIAQSGHTGYHTLSLSLLQTNTNTHTLAESLKVQHISLLCRHRK